MVSIFSPFIDPRIQEHVLLCVSLRFLCAFLGGRRKTPYFSTFLKAPFRYLLVEDKQGSSAVNRLLAHLTAETQRYAEIRRDFYSG
jgi:hypothetical protein